jgi:hypothetical protein
MRYLFLEMNLILLFNIIDLEYPLILLLEIEEIKVLMIFIFMVILIQGNNNNMFGGSFAGFI